MTTHLLLMFALGFVAANLMALLNLRLVQFGPASNSAQDAPPNAQQQQYTRNRNLQLVLDDEEEHASSNSVTNSKSYDKNRVADKMKNIFQFGRGPTHVLLEAAFQTQSADHEEFFYSDDDFRVIQRSIYTLLGLTSAGLRSSVPAEAHFLGTASCLIKLRRPAEEVALGVLHGIYLKQWRKHIYHQGWDQCDQRHVLRQILGSKLEQLIWVEIGSGATGPWDTCVSTWQKMMDATTTTPSSSPSLRRNSTKTKSIQDYLDKTPIAFQLCDEMEEVMGGDGMLGGNWKRRSDKFYQDLMKLADGTGNGKLLMPQLQASMEFADTLFPSKPTEYFRQLHPPNATFLFGTVETRKDAHPKDVQRFQELLNQQGRSDRRILPLFLGNQIQQNLRNNIRYAEELCDQVDSGELTLKHYVKKMNSVKNKLLYCERNDERFASPLEMPRHIPDFAIPPKSPTNEKNHPNYLRNYKHDADYEAHLLEQLRTKTA